jgi:hypothetical protein
MVNRSIHEEFIQWCLPDTPYSDAKRRMLDKDWERGERAKIPAYDDADKSLEWLKNRDSYKIWCKKNGVKPSKPYKGYIPPEHPPRPEKMDKIQLFPCFICGEYFTNFDEFVKDRDRHILKGEWNKAMDAESHEYNHYLYNYRFLRGRFVQCGPMSPEYKAEIKAKGSKRVMREWLMRLDKMTPQEYVGYHWKKRELK